MQFNFLPKKSKPQTDADFDNYENNAPAIALFGGISTLAILLLSVNEVRTYYAFFVSHVPHGLAVILAGFSVVGIGWFFLSALSIGAENDAKIKNPQISGNIDHPQKYYYIAAVVFVFIFGISSIGGKMNAKAIYGQDVQEQDLTYLTERLNKAYSDADAAYSQQVGGTGMEKAEATLQEQLSQTIKTFDQQIGVTWGDAKKTLLSKRAAAVGTIQNKLLALQSKNAAEMKATKAEAERVRQESRKQAYALFVSDKADADAKNSDIKKSNEWYNAALNISAPTVTLLLLSLIVYSVRQKTKLETECGIYSIIEVANTSDDEEGEKTIGGLIAFVGFDIPSTFLKSVLISVYNRWYSAYGKKQKGKQLGGK